MQNVGFLMTRLNFKMNLQSSFSFPVRQHSLVELGHGNISLAIQERQNLSVSSQAFDILSAFKQ